MKHCIKYFFLLSMMLFVACNNENNIVPSFTDLPIRVNTSIEGGTSRYAVGDNTSTGEELFAKLFFWYEKDFNELNSEQEINLPAPYFTHLMNDPITSFGFNDSRWLDTGHPYPDETAVYATGYAPRNMLKEDATMGFRKLKVEENDLQKVAHCDFLSCDARENQVGSFQKPFGNSDNNELQFRHLTSKILIYASRHETMTEQVYVRKVSVDLTLNGGNDNFCVPQTIVWQKLSESDNSIWGYEVTETKILDGALTFRDNTEDMIMVLQKKRVDSCYVCQPQSFSNNNISVDLNVTAQYSYMQDFSSTFNFTWSGKGLTINEIDNNGAVTDNGITSFKPGYVYEIYLMFYKTGVIVTAREVEWKYGGIHYIPVYPQGSSQS